MPEQPKNIYDQLVGDEGIKFNVTFDMIDIVITLSGLFAVLTGAIVIGGQINKALNK